MRLATLTLKCKDNWVAKFSKITGMKVEIERCIPKHGNKGQGLLKIHGPEDMTQEEVERKLGSILPGCSTKLMMVSPGHWLGTTEVPFCQLCQALSKTNCILESARSGQEGEIEWSVIAPDASALTCLVKELSESGCQVKVKKVVRLKDARGLTGRQSHALRMAYDLGYFDIPRKINLDQLAKRMEISKPSLDIILRRAQRKLVEEQMASL
ncbi:MAG: helix-turn-helix domain-containing protein [Methanomassiliicoccales archaeon]